MFGSLSLLGVRAIGTVLYFEKDIKQIVNSEHVHGVSSF